MRKGHRFRTRRTGSPLVWLLCSTLAMVAAPAVPAYATRGYEATVSASPNPAGVNAPVTITMKVCNLDHPHSPLVPQGAIEVREVDENGNKTPHGTLSLVGNTTTGCGTGSLQTVFNDTGPEGNVVLLAAPPGAPVQITKSYTQVVTGWGCVPGEVSATDRADFASRWTSRLKDTPFLEDYLKIKNIPADIASSTIRGANTKTLAQEPWYGYKLSGQRCAITSLVDSLRVTDPNARLFTDPDFDIGNDPNVPADQEVATLGDRDYLRKLFLFGLVFDHSWVTKVSDAVRDRSPEQGTPQQGPGTFPLPSLVQGILGVVGSIVNLPPVPLQNVGSLLPPIPQVPVPQQLQSLLTIIWGLDASVVHSAWYRVCINPSANGGEECSIDRVPLGTPWTFSFGPSEKVTVILRMLSPTIGAVDANVQGCVIHDTSAASDPCIGTPAHPPAPRAAHVYFQYDVPGAKSRLTFGFDGTQQAGGQPAGLAPRSSALVNLRDLAAMLGGTVDAVVALQHRPAASPGTASRPAITFSNRRLVTDSQGNVTAEVDPAAFRLQFDPVPDDFTARIELRKQATGSSTTTCSATTPAVDQQLIVTAWSTLTTALTTNAVVDDSCKATRLEAAGTLAKIGSVSPADFTNPTPSAKLDIWQPGGNTSTSIEYTGVTGIDRISANVTHKPATGAPLSVAAVVEQLPKMIHFDLTQAQQDRAQIHYCSNIAALTAKVPCPEPAPTTATSRPKITAHVGGADFGELHAVVNGVPDAFRLAYDLTGKVMSWKASDAVSDVGASGRIKDDATNRLWDFAATLRTIPAQWSFAWADGFTFDAFGKQIGMVSAALSNAGSAAQPGCVPPTTPGGFGCTLSANHAIINLGANDDLAAGIDLVDAEYFRYGTAQVPSWASLAEEEQKAKEVHLEVRGGASKPLTVEADVTRRLPSGTLGSFVVNAVTPAMPKQVKIDFVGDDITWHTDGRMDVTATLRVGPPAHIAPVATPPAVQGVAVRDGRGCQMVGTGTVCRRATLVAINLPGAPTDAFINLARREFRVGAWPATCAANPSLGVPCSALSPSSTGYAPPSQKRSLQVDLLFVHDQPNAPVKLEAVVSGLPPSGIAIWAGPFKIDTPQGGNKEADKDALLPYAASSDVGSVHVRVETWKRGGAVVGDNDTRAGTALEFVLGNVSNTSGEPGQGVPSTVLVDAKVRSDASHLAGDPLSVKVTFARALLPRDGSAIVRFRKLPTRTWGIEATMTNVPDKVTFVYSGYPQTNPDPCVNTFRLIPKFHYIGSKSGLNVDLLAHPSFFDGAIPGIFVHAENLTAELHSDVDGGWQKIDTKRGSAAQPASRLKVSLSGTFKIVHRFVPDPSCAQGSPGVVDLAWDGTTPGQAGRAHVGVDLNIPELTIDLTNFSWLRIAPGLVSELYGHFDDFTLDWGRVSVDAELEVYPTIKVNLFGKAASVPLPAINISKQRNLVVADLMLHLAHNEGEASGLQVQVSPLIPCELFKLSWRPLHAHLTVLPGEFAKDFNHLSFKGNGAATKYYLTPNARIGGQMLLPPALVRLMPYVHELFTPKDGSDTGAPYKYAVGLGFGCPV